MMSLPTFARIVRAAPKPQDDDRIIGIDGGLCGLWSAVRLVAPGRRIILDPKI
jgi:hypothetical protein